MDNVFSFDLSLDQGAFEFRAKAEVPLDGITGISGASGSGKTTLLRVLAGLESKATGRVEFNGEDWSNLPAHQRSVGFVFQDTRLFRHLNVAENLSFGAKRRGVSDVDVAAIVQALDLVELLHRRPASLSGGEARRVALGRAMAAQPKVLFLDEPMVGLDTDRRAEVLPYITRAVDQFALAVFYVSHSQFELNMLADRILPVNNGQVGALQDGPARFNLPVIGAQNGRMTFTLEGVEFSIMGAGQVGETWEIRPGNGGILAQNHPGENSAAAVLPANVVATDADLNLVVLNVGGNLVRIQSATALVPDTNVWLICPRLRARHREA